MCLIDFLFFGCMTGFCFCVCVLFFYIFFLKAFGSKIEEVPNPFAYIMHRYVNEDGIYCVNISSVARKVLSQQFYDNECIDSITDLATFALVFGPSLDDVMQNLQDAYVRFIATPVLCVTNKHICIFFLFRFYLVAFALQTHKTYTHTHTHIHVALQITAHILSYFLIKLPFFFHMCCE